MRFLIENRCQIGENKESYDFSGPRDEERVNEKDSNHNTLLRVNSNEKGLKWFKLIKYFLN